MIPTRPTPSEIVRASSLVEAWRRNYDDGAMPPSRLPLIEAGETLAAALAAERADRVEAERIEFLSMVIDANTFEEPAPSGVFRGALYGVVISTVVFWAPFVVVLR